MTTVIVHHNVADFDAWKPVYDAHEGRQNNGCTSASVLQATDDPNSVTVITEFPTLDNAQGFVSDPSLQEAMKNAGVTSAPDIRIVEVVETKVGADA